MAQGATQEPEQRQLSLERAQAVGIEAKLEDAELLRAVVPRHPDLAEAALAQLALDEPAGSTGDLLAGGGAPAPHAALLQRVGTLHLGRLLGRGRRLAL